MTGYHRTRARRCWLLPVTLLAIIATFASSRAHHQSTNQGATVGVSIPAIGHGEMLIIARYRSQILELAARQPRTDPTLRRLIGFVNLQHFACLWELVPGTISDERSPFNECAHADLAGVRASLAHMIAMPGDTSVARTLDARIAAALASDPVANVLCLNSNQGFDTGVVVGPDWHLAPAHLPTVATFAAIMMLFAFVLIFALGLLRRR